MKMQDSSGQIFYRKLQSIIFVFVVGYAAVFGLLGAYFGAALLLSSGVLLSLLGSWFEKSGRPNWARFVLISSAVFYVYSGPLGVQTPLAAEFYLIPSMLMVLLLFEPKQKREIAIGMFVPTIGWVLMSFVRMPALPATWIPKGFPVEIFRSLNFLGASVVAGLFVLQYSRHIQRLQDQLWVDIAERKKVEGALKRSTDLLEASQTVAKVGGWDLNIATQELFWTEQTYRILGTSAAEMCPTVDSALEFFTPVSREILAESMRQAREHGIGYDLELDVLTKKGQKVFVRATCEVIRHDGLPVRLRGIFQDISQQKAITDALSSARERLAIAVDAVRFGIWDWDLKTGALTWDDNMYGIYGLKKENFGGDYDAFQKTLMPEDATRLTKELNEHFATQESHFDSEFRITDGEGKVRYIKANARCFYDAEGTILRLVGANWDNTAKRNAETALVVSAKMASLGEMAGGVAHEINNPLAIIQGKAGTIKRLVDMSPVDSDRIKVELTKIENTTTRIAKIIKGLLSFSRDAEGDPMTEVRVSQILEDSFELCRERFKNHSIDLRANVAADLVVECRPSEISQVLMNLLSNSHDAVEKLAERWVTVEVSNEGERLKMVVTDSGNGVSQELVDKIMQPFFTTKDVGKGTGLGLSISKGIMEAHHGRLSYDPSSKNTCFVLDFPLRQPA